MFQIKINWFEHSCPPQGGKPKDKTKLENTRWLADEIMDWMRANPSLGATTLIKEVSKKFTITVSYMRMFYAKEMALERINGPWNESFQLLYSFKAEVEIASPGSVIQI